MGANQNDNVNDHAFDNVCELSKDNAHERINGRVRVNSDAANRLRMCGAA